MALGDESLHAYANGYRAAFGLLDSGPEAVEPLWRSSRAAFATLGDLDGMAWSDFNLAFVLLARGERSAARDALEYALDASREGRSDVLFAHTGAALAALLALDEEWVRADGLAAEALAAGRRLGLRHILVMALVRAAEVGLLHGDDATARTHLREALQVLGELGGRMWANDVVQLVGVLLQRDGAAAAAARLTTAGAAGGGAHRPLQVLVERAQRDARSALGEEEFRAACAAGHALTATAALADAMDSLTVGT